MLNRFQLDETSNVVVVKRKDLQEAFDRAYWIGHEVGEQRQTDNAYMGELYLAAICSVLAFAIGWAVGVNCG
jgi:hypothetical protein